MIIRPAAKRPSKQPLLFCDGKVVDACVPYFRKTSCIEFPVFVAVGTKPLTFSVARFVRKPDSNAVAIETPQFLDEPIFELPRPFSFQKLDNFAATMDELRPVSPVAVRRITACDALRIAQIPVVLDQSNF